MKIHTKILIAFISIIILIFIQLGVIHNMENDMMNETLQIKDIEAPLETMVEQVIGYDGILTGNVHASLLHAMNGEYDKIAVHKTRYDEIGIKLDDLLKKDARILLSRSQRPQSVKKQVNEYIKILDKDNIELVNLETKAFVAIDKKDPKTAYSLIVGGKYDVYKDELYQNYRAWADVEHNYTLDVRNDIIEDSQSIIFLSLGISIVIIILIIITMLIIYSFVTKLTLRTKEELQYFNKQKARY